MNELTSVIENEGSRLTCRLSGAVTESADFASVLEAISAHGQRSLTLDVHAVKRINSAGVREWIHFMRALADVATDIELVRASPGIVRQLSMVRNTRGTARVTSIGLPYVCERCDEEDVIDCVVERDQVRMPSEAPRCRACASPMIFDDVLDAYLAFLQDGPREE